MLCEIRLWWPSREYKKFIYRYDPVPGVHKYKKGRTWRRPRTTQERRITDGHIKDGIHVRGRRRPNMIPNVWDDNYIGYMYKYGRPASWKRTKKKKQWM